MKSRIMSTNLEKHFIRVLQTNAQFYEVWYFVTINCQWSKTQKSHEHTRPNQRSKSPLKIPSVCKMSKRRKKILNNFPAKWNFLPELRAQVRKCSKCNDADANVNDGRYFFTSHFGRKKRAPRNIKKEILTEKAFFSSPFYSFSGYHDGAVMLFARKM